MRSKIFETVSFLVGKLSTYPRMKRRKDQPEVSLGWRRHQSFTRVAEILTMS